MKRIFQYIICLINGHKWAAHDSEDDRAYFSFKCKRCGSEWGGGNFKIKY